MEISRGYDDTYNNITSSSTSVNDPRGFPDIMSMEVNNGGHFEFERYKNNQGTFLPETTHFVYSNGLDIWHGLSNIRHNKVSYV